MFYAKSTGGFYDRDVHGSAIPDDAVEITHEEHAVLLAEQSAGKCIRADANGFPVATALPPPTNEQTMAKYTIFVQQRLDVFARTRSYDSILSAATYATSLVPKFNIEGQHAVEVRDATWAKCYDIFNAVEAELRPMPTLEELIAELPVLEWPN